MTKRYTFTTIRGLVCCAADSLALLCSSCRRQATQATTKRGHKLSGLNTAALAARINKPASTYRCKKCGKLHPPGSKTKATADKRKPTRARSRPSLLPAPKPYSIALAGRTNEPGRSIALDMRGRLGPYSMALQAKPQPMTPEERKRARKEDKHRKSLIGAILNSQTLGSLLTEDDLRSMPTKYLERLTKSARDESQDIKAARAAGRTNYVPAPRGYSIAIAKQAARGGA